MSSELLPSILRGVSDYGLFQREISQVREELGDKLPEEGFFKRYEPKDEWFHLEYHGVHGIDHETRVLVLAEVIGRLVSKRGQEIDQEAIRWAAVTHDTQRVNDFSDLGHGGRSASWVRRNLRRIQSNGYTGIDVDKVAYINRWHVPHDQRAPEMTPELKVFKDADGLDRVRVGLLDPSYLRTEEARGMVNVAWGFYRISRDLQFHNRMGGYDSVIKAATLIGLLRPSL